MGLVIDPPNMQIEPGGRRNRGTCPRWVRGPLVRTVQELSKIPPKSLLGNGNIL